jgi:hypothetical protein
MKWLVTAHRDWERLDIAQFEIEADSREQAIEIASRQLAAGTMPWIAGELVKHDEGFVVTPAEEKQP